MSADSHPGPLPLADAMLAWSDPKLIEAIRTEEAALLEAGTLPFDFFALADLRTTRRSPQRPLGFIPTFRLGANWARAWEALYSTWRFEIERGEIILTGTCMLTLTQSGSTVLPKERATELRFDPAAGAVFDGLATYVGVTAARASRALASEAMAGAIRELTLAMALKEWGEPDLVRRLEQLEARKAYFQGLEAQRSQPFLGARVIAIDRSPEELALPGNLDAARKALVEDLRKKIEGEKLGISGVQTFPLRESARKPIPGLWASDFSFDVDASKINVVQFNRTTHSYVAVVIVGPKRDDESSAPNADETSPSAAPRTAEQSEAKTGNGGRPNFGPIIEAALRENWDDVYGMAPEGGRPRWTDAARLLGRRMHAKAKRNEVSDIPHVDTIRTRLPEIYARLLSEKAETSRSTQ